MTKQISKHKFTEYICLDAHLCQACLKCIAACPNGVIGKVDILFHKHARIDHAEKCEGCRECVNVCPQQAITAYQAKV